MIAARSRAAVIGVRRIERMLTLLREHGDTGT